MFDSNSKISCIWLGFIIGLIGQTNVAGQVGTDLVLVIDGSVSVEPCLFAFQQEAISSLICDQICSPCSDANLPHDGSIAIGVIQFSGAIPGGAQVELPLTTVLDSSQSAENTCADVQDIGQLGDTSPLSAGLALARSEFQTNGHANADRVVIIVSDIFLEPSAGELCCPIRIEATLLRTMEPTPARICGFRFSDFPTSGPGGDRSCSGTPPSCSSGSAPPWH